MKTKKEEKIENEESKNFSSMWDRDNALNRISNIYIIFNNIY